MALDQINEYPVTTTVIDTASFFDIDQFIEGTDYESQKVPISVMLKTFATAPIQFAATDLTTPFTVSTFDVVIPIPYEFYATEIRANVKTAPTDADLIFNVKMDGVSVLSTKITIDAGELTSTTATVPAVISTPTLNNDKIITVECTQIGATIAGAGLTITINGYRL
tara:strand:+ start:130 stop:630 length:501 start_codon:yes stop_codon:yes gene_type:complete